MVIAVAGCGGSQFGADLSAKPKPMPIRGVEDSTIRLPADAPFSIRLAPARRDAGLDGTAQADAKADRSGSASASAKVKNGGTAAADFQLGHAFRNDTSRQIDLSFRLQFAYEFDASITPDDGGKDATVGLKLYARDDRNRTLAANTVVLHSTADGPAHGGAKDQQVEFTITLGPGEAVNVYLAGHAAVDTAEQRSAGGRVTLSGLSLEARTHAAPAVKTVGDEQG